MHAHTHQARTARHHQARLATTTTSYFSETISWLGLDGGEGKEVIGQLLLRLLKQRVDNRYGNNNNHNGEAGFCRERQRANFKEASRDE